MKIGTTEKLKFKKLQRILKLPLWQAVGLLESVWKMAYRNAPAGDVGRLSDDDIAAAIEWDGDAMELVDALVQTGWLDRDPTHRLLIHDWEKECEAWLRGNFEKHGKSFAQPTCSVVSNQLEASKQPTEQTAKQPTTTVLLPSPSHTTPYPAAAAPSHSTNGAAAAAVDSEEWEQARPLANRLRSTLFPNRPTLSRTDYEWLAKVAVLGVRYGPKWYEPAFEAIKNGDPQSPVALMFSVLDDECERLGTRLNRELAILSLSEEFLPGARKPEGAAI